MSFRDIVSQTAPELLCLEKSSPDLWAELEQEYQREFHTTSKTHLRLVKDNSDVSSIEQAKADNI